MISKLNENLNKNKNKNNKNIYKKTKIDMKVNGKVTWNMAMESCVLQMVIFIEESGKMENSVEKDPMNTNLKMPMKVNFKMANYQDKEFICGMKDKEYYYLFKIN